MHQRIDNALRALRQDLPSRLDGLPESRTHVEGVSVDSCCHHSLGVASRAGSLQRLRGVRPSVRREKGVGLQWVQFPPGNSVAPAGSSRSGGGGNETVGAFETDVSLWRCSKPTGRNASER